ncbi:MAG: hypothetical protein HQ517_03350 [SAR324 cluster bacterium]|nr:hypothetical protein [SAR324 cluster bacterium]
MDEESERILKKQLKRLLSGRRLETGFFEKSLDPFKPELIKHHLYVADSGEKHKQKTQKGAQQQSEWEKYIICVQCENRISQSIYKISHQGTFEHTFLNPAGHVFHIGCFKRADGCLVLGKPSLEWTWFQGWQWRVALCGRCLKHLGWYYQTEQDSSFFGLILDALI